MGYNFPQTNIRLCLKEKNIPEYLIDIIVNNYNNSYYIHKVLEESRNYHISKLKSSNNYALNFQIELFHPGFIRFTKEYDYEHNEEHFTVIDEFVPENLIRQKIRTTNLLMNWTKENKQLEQISENDGNIYICAGKRLGHWFNTIQEQQRNLVISLETFKKINENYYFMFGMEPRHRPLACVESRLYGENLINISIFKSDLIFFS